MAKISTYPSADTPLLLSDRLIGTEAPRIPPSPTPLATKNFSLSELLNLFSVNFPAASLQEVLNTGNTATQDIYLTGTIEVDLIKPVNIEDPTGSQGTTFQYLSKGTSSINWVNLPVDNLQAVLNSGNTATQNITLVGNVTSTYVTPGNIKDELLNTGAVGQVLTKSTLGVQWKNSSVPSAPSLGDVLFTGNSATNDINLTGNMYATTFVKSGGTSSQFLKADGSVDSSTYALASSLPTLTSDLTNDGDDGINPFISLADVPAQVNSDWNATSGVAEILNKPTLTNGTVTSVGLTMPSAFSVANSPITSSGDIAVTGAGTVSQYVRGDGSLANFPSSTGGGSSLAFYLNGSVAQGTFGGVAFKEMDRVPILGTGTDFTINANGYIQSFITDANVPNQLEIPAGNWNFETYFSASSSGGTPSFYVELYKWDGTTLSLIASNSATPEGITNGTAIDAYFSALAVPQTTLAATDRLAIRIYVTHSGRTITLHTENSHLCEVITTFSTGLTALNGLTAQVQNFATGTSGTDFAISSATSTHTFNLPTASAANRGALSSADWSAFNGKFTLPSLTSGSVLFSNGTTIAQDNANLFFDDTNNRLGIGTASPDYKLTISDSGTLFTQRMINTLNTGRVGFFLQNNATAYSGLGTYGTAFALTALRNNTTFFASNDFQIAAGDLSGTGTLTFSRGANSGTETMRIAGATGNVLIGTTTDAGYKLDVNGTTRLNGLSSINGAGVANTALAIYGNGTGGGNYIINAYDSAAAQRFYLTASGNFRLNGATDTATTGTDEKWRMVLNFAPTSGTRQHNGIYLTQTINQTGGANGVTRGLLIEPTLTAAADFRAIETTVGNVTLNTTSGNTLIGTATSGGFKLEVNGTTKTGDITIGTLGSSNVISFGGNNNQIYRDIADNSLNYKNVLSATTVHRFRTNSDLPNANTTGTNIFLSLPIGFAPTSGTGTWTQLSMTHTINQTGGANGITRGLYIAPTLTAVADYRSLETTVGKVCLNTTSGNTLIGTTTDAGFKLDVNGTARVQNDLTITDTFKIVSSANANTKITFASNLSLQGQGGILLQGGHFITLNGVVFGATSVNASAVLQADSTNRGFLPPRMTNAQRLAIATPAVGLIVYCTDVVEGLYINKSTGWTFII